MKLNDFFDAFYCVSHPITGRKKAMEKHLAEFGLTANFLYSPAPDRSFTLSNMRRNPRREMAVSLSHVTAIIRALDDSMLHPLFLEDDVRIGEHEHLESAINDLPVGWSVLYLGGHPCEDVDRIGDHLVRVGRFSFAEAYAINGFALGPFLEYWCSRIGQPNAMFDRILGEFAANTHGYCVYPTVTSQLVGYSYVAEKDDDKTHCLESGWANHLKD